MKKKYRSIIFYGTVLLFLCGLVSFLSAGTILVKAKAFETKNMHIPEEGDIEKAEQERIEKEMREQEEKKSRITRAIAWIIIVVLAIILILSLPYIMDLYNYVRPLYICPTASHDNIANIDNLTGEISSNRFINRSVAFINII